MSRFASHYEHLQNELNDLILENSWLKETAETARCQPPNQHCPMDPLIAAGVPRLARAEVTAPLPYPAALKNVDLGVAWAEPRQPLVRVRCTDQEEGFSMERAFDELDVDAEEELHPCDAETSLIMSTRDQGPVRRWSSSSTGSHNLPLSRWEQIYERLIQMTSSALSVLHHGWRARDRRSIGSIMKSGAQDPSNSSDRSFTTGLKAIANARAQTMRTKGPVKFDRTESSAWLNLPAWSFWPTAMHPYSAKRVIWDVFVILFWAYDVVTLPVEVFQLPEHFVKFMDHFEFVVCVFWSLDVLVSFVTGYQTRDAHIVLTLWKVAATYLRSWFPFDVFLVATTWAAYLSAAALAQEGVVSLAIPSYIRVVGTNLRYLSLLRVFKVELRARELVGSIRSEVVYTLVGLVRVVLVIAVLNHYAACFWYLLGVRSESPATWVEEALKNSDSVVYAYATAFHWSMTHFTPASMEVVPTNVPERLFSCALIFIGLIVFSSFLSLIQRAALHLQAHYSRQFHDEMQVRRFFAEHGISRELAGRVRRFMHLNKSQDRKRIRQHEVMIFKVLPKSVLCDLAVEQFLPHLLVHPFFYMYHKWEARAVRRMCITGVEERRLLPEEELFPKGLVNRYIYVLQGALWYDIPNEVPMTVSPGEWACEEALWSGSSFLQAPIRAGNSACELLLLDPTELRELARMHIRSLAFVLEYAERFIKRFNLASQDEEYSNLLFNDADEIGHIVIDACGAAPNRMSPRVSLGLRQVVKTPGRSRACA